MAFIKALNLLYIKRQNVNLSHVTDVIVHMAICVF